MTRILLVLAAALLAVSLLAAACARAPAAEPTGPTASPLPDAFADRLVADGVPDPFGADGPPDALAWTSAIQAPNRQTDRDVGAAGIAHGLLALAAATPDPAARERHLAGARSAGDFLLGASRGGRVPDYVNPDGPAARAYTSFDDGAAGVAEVLWRLGDATGDDRYRAGARDSLRWVLDRAEGVDGAPCPQMCRWAWVDGGSEPPSYRHGMGEGQAGIVYALSVMAERTGDPELAAHAAGGAAYLSSRLDDDGGLPERADEPRRNTGFLSGTAGAAFVFLRMYQATGEERWRRDAEAALGFLDRTAQPAGGGLTWPILLGAGSGALTPDNPNRATGMEEGAAGIGWVSLQAHAILDDPRHLERARGAGRWLVSVALDEPVGLAWAEYEGSRTVHASTNSGAAGTGWFLDSLGRVTRDGEFSAAARDARAWLLAVATPDGHWGATRQNGTWTLGGEPSWHWGSAGVIGFLSRLAGGPVDSPGMQEVLVPLEGPATG
jgi:Lanthionine synthetase C-like protein